MTDSEARKVAVLIESHWPRPEFTDVDIAVLAESLRRHRVTYQEAVDAVHQLVWAGERFQPRAPALTPMVRAARRASPNGQRQIAEPAEVVGAQEYKQLLASLRKGMTP